MVTLTTDSGKILAKLHAMQPKGDLKLLSGIKIAHLALKHRLGKNHKTRIVMFVGSPIEAEEKELIKIAKKLKKEKVSVDVVSFGEDDCNKEMLGKFIETVNGRDGKDSHMLSIPTGPHLSDALVSSAIVQVCNQESVLYYRPSNTGTYIARNFEKKAMTNLSKKTKPRILQFTKSRI